MSLLRAHCGAIVERGAPATAIHVRDIAKQIYGFAILHGEKVANPADDVGPASIATFVPKDRSLSPTEIRIMLLKTSETGGYWIGGCLVRLESNASISNFRSPSSTRAMASSGRCQRMSRSPWSGDCDKDQYGTRRPPRINLQAARRRSLGEHPKRSVNALVKAAADR
jgi:hypothetical protein